MVKGVRRLAITLPGSAPEYIDIIVLFFSTMIINIKHVLNPKTKITIEKFNHLFRLIWKQILQKNFLFFRKNSLYLRTENN